MGDEMMETVILKTRKLSFHIHLRCYLVGVAYLARVVDDHFLTLAHMHV